MAELLDLERNVEVAEQLLPAAIAGRPRRLRDVAEERHRPAAGPPRQRPQLHRGQILSLVDDHVPVRVRCPVQQRRRLVEQCEIRLAPSASPRQPPDERLRRHTRKRSGDDAVEISAASERTLHVLERAVSGAAELLSVQAVHAPYELRAEALACRGDRIGSRYGVLDELRELVRIDAHLGAVKPHGDERFRDRRNRAHRLVEQRRHGQTALLACEIARVSGCHRDIAAEDLRQRALVDALLAEHRQHVRDVLHEDRVRAGDDTPVRSSSAR
jgi:hypothetical protein